MCFFLQGRSLRTVLALVLLASGSEQLAAATRPQEGYDGLWDALDISLLDLLNSSSGGAANSSSGDLPNSSSAEAANSSSGVPDPVMKVQIKSSGAVLGPLAGALTSSSGVADALNASSGDVLEPVSEDSAARNQFHSDAAKIQALQDCHTAEKGDYCYNAIQYAMHEGVEARPDQYGGLTKDSSFHDFQLWLYEDGRYSCDFPCPGENSTAALGEKPAKGSPAENGTAALGEKKTKGNRRKRGQASPTAVETNAQHASGEAHAGHETAAQAHTVGTDKHEGGPVVGGHNGTGGGAARRGRGRSHDDKPRAHLALCFLVGGVFIGAIVQVVQERLLPVVPFTCLLFLMGLGLGCLHEVRPARHWSAWPTWYVSVSMWEDVGPHLVFYVFLPLLVFAKAMRLNINLAKRLFAQVLLLATVGVVIGTALTAVFSFYVLPYGWSWASCCAFGAILATTDPMAVAAPFNALGASPRLAMLVSGESLLNDGTAIVLFTLALQLMLGEPIDVAHVFTFFLRMTTLSVFLGIALAAVALVIIKQCAETKFRSDAMIQVTVTVCLSMLCFFMAESEVHTCGALAVVAAGCVISYAAWPNFASHETMHTVWEVVEFIGNTAIFLLAGLLFGQRCFMHSGHLELRDGLFLILLYVGVTLIRAIVFLLLWPILNLLGRRVTWKEVVVMTWVGVRGAVGLVLAFIVDQEPSISQRIGSHFIVHVAGVAMLTMLVNATLCAPLLRALGFTTPSHIDEQIAHHFEKVTRDDARRIIEEIIQEGAKELSKKDPPAMLAAPLQGQDGCRCNGGLGPDGKVYFAPCDARCELVMDADAPAATMLGPELRGECGLINGILAPDGKIYFAPSGASQVLVVDTRTSLFAWCSPPTWLPLIVDKERGKSVPRNSCCDMERDDRATQRNCLASSSSASSSQQKYELDESSPWYQRQGLGASSGSKDGSPSRATSPDGNPPKWSLSRGSLPSCPTRNRSACTECRLSKEQSFKVSVKLPTMAESKVFAKYVLPFVVLMVGAPVAWFLTNIGPAKVVEYLESIPLGLLVPGVLGGFLYSNFVWYYYHFRRLEQGTKPPPSPSLDREPFLHICVVVEYQEPLEVLTRTVASITKQSHIHRRPVLVMACEARDQERHETCEVLRSVCGDSVEDFIMTEHTLQPGENVGKHSNENHAVREVYRQFVEEQGIPPFQIMLTIIDADSILSEFYLSHVEYAFHQMPDGRRLIYNGPLNTYRNLDEAGLLVQCVEIGRCHVDVFHDPCIPYHPQSNYSLTLGMAQEIDYWMPDCISEDMKCHVKAVANNFGSLTTVSIPAFICNDLVVTVHDRYVQAKRHQWGAVEEFPWHLKLACDSPLNFRLWWAIFFDEWSRPGSLLHVGCMMSQRILGAIILYYIFVHRPHLLLNPRAVILFAVVAGSYVLFWMAEIALWKRSLGEFPIHWPSKCRLGLLIILSPILNELCALIFKIGATLDCVFHITFRSHYLTYVNAPKGNGAGGK